MLPWTSVRELTSQFLLAVVELVLLALFDRSEASQHLHELTEVDAVIVGVCNEGVDYSVAEWVDSELRYSQKVFT